MKNLAILILVPFLVSGAVLPIEEAESEFLPSFTSCGAGIPTPDVVRVIGCTKEPCEMKIGGVGISQADFTLPFDTNTVTPEVRGKSFGISIKYKLPDEVVNDGCKHTIISGSCPLKKGEQAQFKLALPVDSPLANINVDMTFHLLGDNKQVLFCYQMKMRVVR